MTDVDCGDIGGCDCNGCDCNGCCECNDCNCHTTADCCYYCPIRPFCNETGYNIPDNVNTINNNINPEDNENENNCNNCIQTFHLKKLVLYNKFRILIMDADCGDCDCGDCDCGDCDFYKKTIKKCQRITGLMETIVPNVMLHIM
ncbi:uncharacterized protein ACRADG_003834 isoform 3-T8 [Cochliomyia hominivorax]